MAHPIGSSHRRRAHAARDALGVALVAGVLTTVGIAAPIIAHVVFWLVES